MKIHEKISPHMRLQALLVLMGILTLVSILVLIIFPATRKGPLGFGPPAPMVTFQAKDRNFSISYPENWSAFDTPQGSHGDNEIVAVILIAGQMGSNVTIARRSFPNGDISDVVAWGESRAAIQTNYTSISFSPLTDNELGGVVHEYTGLGSSLYNITRRCQDVYVFAKNTGYDLSFCLDEQDWESLEKIFIQMRQSFVIDGAS